MGKSALLSEQSLVEPKSKPCLKSRDVTGLSVRVCGHEGGKGDFLGDGKIGQTSFQQLDVAWNSGLSLTEIFVTEEEKNPQHP